MQNVGASRKKTVPSTLYSKSFRLLHPLSPQRLTNVTLFRRAAAAGPSDIAAAVLSPGDSQLGAEHPDRQHPNHARQPLPHSDQVGGEARAVRSRTSLIRVSQQNQKCLHHNVTTGIGC